jgi:transcriptional regulator with XRE-family HTH domain
MQSRAARGLLGWSLLDLSKAAGVSVATISDFESGKRQPQPATLAVLRRAFEDAGIVFTPNGRGVMLRDNAPESNK